MAELPEILQASGGENPIKKEMLPLNLVKVSPNSTPERMASPEPNCAICLSKPENKCFTNSCLHQFCYKCLLEWSKVKPECPLCKQNFKSIIHNVRSIEDYDQYDILPRPVPEMHPRSEIQIALFNTNDLGSNGRPRFSYRTTMTSSILFIERTTTDRLIDHSSWYPNNRHVLPTSTTVHVVGALERRHRGTSEFRRIVYQSDLWVRPIPDVTGRTRESSPEFYRLCPAQTHRLAPWLNRELNVLLTSANDALRSHVADVIMGLLIVNHIRSAEFRSNVYPYFTLHTDHFIHEFHTFATSPYDLVGYDQHAEYVPSSSLAHERYQDPGSGTAADISDSDSEVQEITQQPLGRYLYLPVVPVPQFLPSGPSTSSVNPTATSPPATNQPALQINLSSDNSDSSNDCEIIETVKPMIPEIITLDSEEEVGSRRSARVKSFKRSKILFREIISIGEAQLHPSASTSRRNSITIKENSSDSDVKLSQIAKKLGKTNTKVMSSIESVTSSSMSSGDEWQAKTLKRTCKSIKRSKKIRSTLKSNRSSPTHMKHWKKKLLRERRGVGKYKKHRKRSRISSSSEESDSSRNRSRSRSSSPDRSNKRSSSSSSPIRSKKRMQHSPNLDNLSSRPRLRSVVKTTKNTKRHIAFASNDCVYWRDLYKRHSLSSSRNKNRSRMNDGSRNYSEDCSTSSTNSFSPFRGWIGGGSNAISGEKVTSNSLKVLQEKKWTSQKCFSTSASGSQQHDREGHLQRPSYSKNNNISSSNPSSNISSSSSSSGSRQSNHSHKRRSHSHHSAVPHFSSDQVSCENSCFRPSSNCDCNINFVSSRSYQRPPLPENNCSSKDSSDSDTYFSRR